ncbi:hypothetical protein [uncultured Lutibacter sp.]|uniref:XAC2610-related protein n=1 Tax=uncultured Lutibacter sp. TaxID=437739 RepID=UPI002612A6A3|nr:hypothetical protein [uncultured Lutibacter sp.]
MPKTNLKFNISNILSSNDSIVGDKIAGNQFSYKFNADSTGHLLKSITVYSEGSKIQEIIANKATYDKKYGLIDWNFDGYKDITVLYNSGSGGCAYWIWNYSQNDGKFYYNDRLSEKLGLEIDPASKYIIFHYRAGWPEERWDTLKYLNNKLKFVKGLYQERWIDSDGNSWVKNTSREFINDEIIQSVDSLIIK